MLEQTLHDTILNKCGLSRIKLPATGDCLYHAIATILNHLNQSNQANNDEHNHVIVKNEIGQHILSHMNFYEQIVTDISIVEYVQHMIQPSVYGGEIEIHAACDR
jgi:hypothetical protein